MKLRKFKPQSAPVPTDNPKPKSRNQGRGTKYLARVATEPTPQPAVGKIKTTLRKLLRVVEPLPQPVVPKAKAGMPPSKIKRSRKKTPGAPENSEARSNIEEAAAPAPIIQSAATHETAGPSPAASKVANFVEKKEASKTVARMVRQPRPVPVEIPALLLEPDHTPGHEPALTGPGARFLATPTLEPIPVATPPTELPESYSTQQIFLAARDPFWLLASWDLDETQRMRYNGQSATGALSIRLRKDDAEGPIHLEVHVKSQSRDWFIYAGAPDVTFVGELGFPEKNSGVWRRISISKPVTMPRDRSVPAPAILHAEAAEISHPPRFDPAPPQSEEIFFAAIEPLRFLESTKEDGGPDAPIRWEPAQSVQPAQWDQPKRPELKSSPPPAWTKAQERALEELISLEWRRWQHGSLEIEEMLRRHIGRPADAAALPEAPSSLEMARLEEMLGLAQAEAPSSLELAERPASRKTFWFKINAELIIYGSTEPNAHVSIGGRTIRLREDGTFSYRFALPDGEYGLPVLAISSDYSEARGADLRFARATQYMGEVGAHSQDFNLKSPSAANV